MKTITFKVQITGRVQGVGFRPFIFNLAKENNLVGSVSNNANGVIIYANTSEEKVAHFVAKILKEKPEVSIITNHSIEEVSFIEFESFKIISTEISEQINIPLTPDFAVCNNCKEEIKTPIFTIFNFFFAIIANSKIWC